MSDAALRDAQTERGAQFADGAGAGPTDFGDWLGEYRAVRHSAGLLDRSDGGKLAVTGEDRHTWLQGMVSADVRELAAGTPALDACILDATGHLITDLRIVDRGDALLLDLPRRNLVRVMELLDGYVIAEDVELVDQSDFLACFSAQGPKVDAVALAELAGPSATVVPADHTGAGGVDVYLRAEDAPDAWRALVEAGLTPVGSRAAEVLRVEEGLPLFGVDMDNRTLPPEAGLDASHASYEKGCYVGQEVLARIRNRGHTNRALTGLLVEGETLPAPGDVVLPADDDREAGRITSAVHSPALDRVIALAMLRHEHREPGTALRILHGEDALSAVATPLPFVGRKP